METSFFLADEAATQRFANDLAMILRPGDLLTLQGDLGAGKSTFAREIVRVLAHNETLDVPSPTFTLVQTYDETRFPVAHADLYRLTDPQEIEELGLTEMLNDGIVLVEWPENAEQFLPQVSFALKFLHDGNGRRVNLIVQNDRFEALQQTCVIRQFLEKAGYGLAKRLYLAGDASARSYEFIVDEDVKVLMNAPIMELPETGVQPYAKIAHLAPDMKQFVGIDMMIREQGFYAPEICASDYEHGLLLMEDLGQNGIITQTREPIRERYLAAAELLVKFHEKSWTNLYKWDDFSIIIPPFDEGAMMAELSLLPQWYIPYKKNREMTNAEKETFIQAWEPLIAHLQTVKTTFVMRDFHSPNLIWREDKTGTDRLGLIDFQDGLIGPEAYDLASLAQDARVTISANLEQEILRHYCDMRKNINPEFDEKKFLESYAMMAAQRASKILGIFVRLKLRDYKPNYLKHLPRLIDYLQRSFKHPVLKPLKQCYEDLAILE